MLEHIHGIPNRIADLKRKLAARDSKAEYKENVPAIRAEIARLEAVTKNRPALDQFLAENAPGASEDSNPLAAGERQS